jgi:hypothetical protein
MMLIRDAFLLARTKLRARRIRLMVLLITMSVLFAGLVFIANVASGVITSVHSFSKEGYGNSYYVAAHPTTYLPYGNTALIDQVKPKQEVLIAQKKALAKKLDITYDPKTDSDLYYIDQQVGPNPTDTQPMLGTSALAIEALRQENASIPGIRFEDFAKRAKQAGALNVYRMTGNGFGFGQGSSTGTLNVLLGGKEDYSGRNNNTGPPTGIGSIQTLGWNQMSDELMRPFLLSGQTTALGKDGGVPVVAPFSAAEQILGMSKLPATATTQEKLDRLVAVRTQIAGKTAQLCYRNTDSAELLQKALQQKSEIEANKKNADYTAPHLQYNRQRLVLAHQRVYSRLHPGLGPKWRHRRPANLQPKLRCQIQYARPGAGLHQSQYLQHGHTTD